MRIVVQLEKEIRAFEQNEQSYSLEERLHSLKKLLYRAHELRDFEQTDYLIKEKIFQYVSSPFSLEVMKMMKLVEPCYKLRGGKELAEFYCITGHVFFFVRDYGRANHYYKLAISQAVQQRCYGIAAAAMQNVLWQPLRDNPSESTLNMARALPLLSKSARPYSLQRLVGRTMPYIECAIKLKRFDEAELLIESIRESGILEEQSREFVQLCLIKGMIDVEKGRYDEALMLYHEMLTQCIEQEQHFDFVIEMYGHIASIAKVLQQEEQIEQAQQQANKLVQTRMREHQYIETYLRYYKKNTSAQQSQQLGMKKSDFTERTNNELERFIAGGQTFIMLDCYAHEDMNLEPILQAIHEQMKELLQLEAPFSTRYDYTTLVYIVPKSETFCIEGCQALVQRLYEQFGEALHMLEFAVVPTTKYSYNTLAQYVGIARAYIYYKLYK